jgi:hypothetical protein
VDPINCTEKTRPAVTDILVELSRQVPISALEGLIPALKDALQSSSEGCDVLVRKEAIIFDLSAGRMVVYDSGTIHGRFREVDLARVCKDTRGVADKIVSSWDLPEPEKLPLLEADVMFRVKACRDVVEWLSTYLKKDDVALSLWDRPMNICAVGFTLFLTEPNASDCVRVHVGPHRDNPHWRYYVRVAHRCEGVLLKNLEETVLAGISFLPTKLWEPKHA